MKEINLSSWHESFGAIESNNRDAIRMNTALNKLISTGHGRQGSLGYGIDLAETE